MEILFLLGRILFGGYFIMNGINHFKNAEGLTQYAKFKKVPGGKLAVYFSGLLILLGGFGILLGVYPIVSLWLIIVFLIPVTFKMHDFWKATDPTVKMPEQINFMKNIALIGATLMMMTLSLPWVLSLM